MTAPRRPARRTPTRLRSLLLAGLLLPVVFLGVHGVESVSESWSRRDASAELRAGAEDLRETVELLAALTDEEARSVQRALESQFGIVSDTRAGMLEARARVDAVAPDDLRPGVLASLDQLRALRSVLDAGDASWHDVDRAFDAVHDELDVRWQTQMADIEAAADDRELAAGFRARLRNLRASLALLTLSDELVDATLDTLLADGDDATRDLIASLASYESALDGFAVVDGSAASTWRRFREEPSVVRMEALFDDAVDVALERRPPLDLTDLPAVADTLADGGRWALVLAELVSASAADLAADASDGVAAGTRDAIVELVSAVAVLLLSLGIVVFLTREIVRPARDLEEAARRIQHGELEIPPLVPHGPLELRATVEAFNDMALTLAAVEDHAVALAEDPDSPVHADQLPGRTGQAIQGALDVLRASISAAEQHRVELLELATRDGLTGLLNRTAAMDAIERDLARTRREGGALLALYVDLDGLKELNDTFGHAVGDEAIRRTGEALAVTTREADVVARLGGDEFLVVGPVPADGDGGVRAFAERVLEAVSERMVDLEDGSQVRLGCSVGVAITCPQIEDAGQLVRAADVALYEAKEAGRGRVAWHTPPECAPA